MSKIKLQQPVIHTPSFKRYGVQQSYLAGELKKLSLHCFPVTDDYVLDAWYYYTNLKGWAKILPDLVSHSNLYKSNVFDCEDYALKAQVECALRYGLNSFRMCIGNMPQGMHGFNIFPYGDETGIQGFMLFEPNDGFDWAGNAFKIGDNGYVPMDVFITSRR